MDYAEKMQRRHEYVEALEEERRKIQVFQRELPLCFELVTQAIEAYRRDLSGTTTEYMQDQSDCSEQTSSDGPVLEEFIPIKRNDSGNVNGNDNGDDDDDREDEEEGEDRWTHKRISKNKSGGSSNNTNKDNDKDHKRKSDWLRSVQLWNQSPDPLPPCNKEEVPKKAVLTEVKMKGTGGAFQPFQREKSTVGGKSGNSNNSNVNSNIQAVLGKAVPSPSVVMPASATSSSAETVGSGGGTSRKEAKEGGQRKQRRCWSPELHRRFLHALQQLGGSHVATPKQIRELMKVDGLTNDEVKSHLQKYRLHTRRPNPTVHNSNNHNHPQTPQFLVVGGIWVSPPEYATVATTTTASGETASTAATANGIYAPVATTPVTPASATTSVAQKPDHQKHSQVSEGRGSHREGGHGRCNSPSTSSSTHTTTTSPVH